MSAGSADKKVGECPASHGPTSEVTWDDGAGKQPYSNQGEGETNEAGGGDEFAEGDRSELSGRNQSQLEQAKRKP